MKRIIKDILVIFIICSLIIFLWFHKSLIFASGEEGIPFYDIQKTIGLYSYLWWDVSAGYPNFVTINRLPYFKFLELLSFLAIPNYLIEAISFFTLMFIGTISVYFLLRITIYKELEHENNFKHVPLIGGIFYLLNPFSMTQIWGRSLYIQFFPFALLPAFLLLFILGLKKRNLIYGIFGILTSFFLAGGLAHPSYIFSLWFTSLIYLIFHISKNIKKEIIFSLIYFLFMFISWVLIHFWWLYPFIRISKNPFIEALNYTEYNIGTLNGVSRQYPLVSLIRLIHEGYFFEGEKYGKSYLSFSFQLISWLIPIVALFSYSVFRKLKHFAFFGPLFLISLFICLGSNFPTGWLFVFIFKTFPFLQAFRNPFEKFGIVWTLSYAAFFGLGLSVICNFFKKTIWRTMTFLIILFLVCGLFLWPMWTGHFAGGFKINPWVKVPDYYKLADDWLVNQGHQSRIIQFPINPGGGVKYGGWEHPYEGIEPGEYLFTFPSIGKNGGINTPYYNILLQRFGKLQKNLNGLDTDLTYSEFSSSKLYQELEKLDVRYIILHHDIDLYIDNFNTAEEVIQYLNNQEKIKKINTFGLLDIYEVSINPDVELIYSPTLKVSYKKINPTLYSVDIIGSESPWELYFLENYDDGWQALIENKKIENHQKVFSYANKWTIDRLGDYSITIKFKPQDYTTEGMLISKITIVIILLFLGSTFLWRRKKI